MKRKRVLLGLLVLVLVLAFVFAACGGGEGGSSQPLTRSFSSTATDGTRYDLTITQNLSRAYAGAVGDTYVLVITLTDGSTRISEGIVISVSQGGGFQLQPNNTNSESTIITIAIAGDVMVSIISPGGITITVGTGTGTTITPPGNVNPDNPIGSDSFLGETFTRTFPVSSSSSVNFGYTYGNDGNLIPLTQIAASGASGNFSANLAAGTFTVRLGKVHDNYLVADSGDGRTFAEAGLILTPDVPVKFFQLGQLYNNSYLPGTNQYNYIQWGNGISKSAAFFYSTHDVVVTGSVLPPPGAQGNYFPMSVYLNLKAGWNIIIQTVTATNAQGQVTAFSMTSGIPDSSIMWGFPAVTGNASTAAVTINNLTPNEYTNVRVTPQTLSQANFPTRVNNEGHSYVGYDFTDTAWGDHPYLVWRPFSTLTNRYSVVIWHSGSLRYLNNVQFTNGLATVNWNAMTVVPTP